MMRSLAAIISLLYGFCVAAAWAQDPQITVTTEQDDVMVGQPYIVRIDLLVPTFMPRPPIFPSFEAPGLIVRLPERATLPISERISGKTWAGVRRTYRIYPTREGTIELPPKEVSFVYRDLQTNEDVPASVEVPTIRIKATVPSGARTLDPLILAQNVSIAQGWQVIGDALSVGDAIVRTLDISVTGTSALFVPDLLEGASPRPAPTEADQDSLNPASFLSYPEDAKVSESIDGATMSGTRSEQISYIAQSGGRVVFPDITLSWYNIGTGEIEDLVLPGRSIVVKKPPQVRAPLDSLVTARILALLIGCAGLTWAAHRWLSHRISEKLKAIRQTYEATAHAAHRAALSRTQARDLNGLLSALEVRSLRGFPPPKALKQAINALTRAKYGDVADTAAVSQGWQSVERVLKNDQPSLLSSHLDVQAQTLPTLNPFVDGTHDGPHVSPSKTEQA